MNIKLMNELYKKYDQKELEKYNKAFVDDRLSSLKCWCGYEHVDVIYRCNTIAELEELYKFIHYGIGVEFLESVYELIEEDEIDGDTENKEMCRMFNKAMGRNIIPL